MAEFVTKLERLIALGDTVHWFCPRTSSDDPSVYFDEDLHGVSDQESDEDRALRETKVKEAEKRRDDALESCKILAFDGDDAKSYQDKLQKSLKTQFSRCDICIREFHRSRALLVASLEAEYPADDVIAFMEKFDAVNTTRVVEGLNHLTETLMDLPPEERSILGVGDVGMYALFEALHCVPFLNDEDMVMRSFDKPFRLVQTRKKIRLPSFVPGMAAFLFSSNQERITWATRNFSSIKRPLLEKEFEFGVKPFWTEAMRRVNIVSLELDFLPRFWSSTRLIASKLTKELVTNHVRGMEVNLFTLSLEHFQVDSSHFADLVSCYKIFLQLSPNDFWDAMGSASAQSIIELICQSPALDRLLTITEETEPLNLEQKMSWALTFISHIKPANLVPPLRTILDQFLHRFQDNKYSRYGRNITWATGLRCLVRALDCISAKVDGGPVYTNLLEMIAKDHIEIILQELEGIEKKTEMSLDETESLGVQIVEKMIALDIKSLSRDRRVILRTKELDHGIGSPSLNIWRMSMRHVKEGYPVLGAAILSSLKPLLSLEKIPPTQIKLAPKLSESWNNALTKILSCITTDLLERLESFGYESLIELFQEPGAADGIVALLFDGDESVHQASLSILKSLSGEDSRRDSLMHVVKVFFATTLAAVAHSVKAVSEAEAFTPCPVLLKVCTDIYSCLCDSQDGMLRSQPPETENDLRALGEFWQATWTSLQIIFEKTETWSSQGYEKSRMLDFCRETMDFAEYAFDQYSIIANTLQRTSFSKGIQLSKELLQLPNRIFRSITKWLRLRDDYLITKSVSLTTKILRRLQQADIKISEDAAQYLEDIVTSGDYNAKVKTKLSMNQKAELQRALEQHLGEPLNEVIELTAPARKKQSSLQSWATSGRESGSSTPRSSSEITQSATKFNKLKPSTTEQNRKRGITTKPRGQKATERIVLNSKQQQSNDFLLKRQQAKAEYEMGRQAALAKEGGGGSGLVGIGNLGQEHSTKGQTVMISSDEESDEEDEDDDLDNELFGTSVKSKERQRLQRPNLVPDGALGPRPEQKKGPTRIQRAARSLKDMRARLAPDLAPLHRVILGWDFFHDGDYPPNANPEQFVEVPDTFTDPTSYQETFEPLLILEAWQGMVKAREENASKPYEIKVQNRSTVDHFLEISSILGHAENRELQLQEGDIILLSKAPKPADDASSPHCLARIYRVKRQKAHLELVYQIIPSGPLAPQLTMQTIVYGLKIQSITPLEREYGALKALQYYDLCNQIVRAKPSARIAVSDRQISALQDVYNVNRAQSEAINAALENDGFSLIQGPPGSGKTKTIVAIVGGLLSPTLSNPARSTTQISMPRANGNQNGNGDAPSRKLLVCAPSNAAVDELVMRLKDGVRTRAGVSHPIKVVRIGRSDAINAQVRDVTIDELVAARLGNANNDAKTREKNAELFKEHEQISAQLRDLYQQRDSGDVKGAELTQLETTLTNVRRRKNELGVRIDNVKDQERNAGREAELNRKRMQQAILDEAHVICATLSGSGHDMFQGLNIEFETVVIDEAAQCVEMSSLIPLKYGCIKCIMVGDPKQLPPTVFSKEAAKFQYEQSLFVRMQNNFSKEVHLLDTQYRMHPNISVFPSEAFYDGLLKDGHGMEGLRHRPWHSSTMLAPYRFFDVKGQQQSAPKGHSLINLAEIDVALALFGRLTSDFKDYDFAGKVGIITPYKSQLKALKDRFSKTFGASILDAVEFNTTDAFQGRESEIIIFSCVRASPAGGIGFLQDIRRMNVGLTRAKSSMWVLGNSDSLVRGRYWKKLVDDAQARGCYTTGNLLAMLEKPSSAYPAGASAKIHSGVSAKSRAAQMHDRSAINGSSRNGDKSPSENGNAAPETNHIAQADRMEGIRYRFEDRVNKVQKAPARDGEHGRSPLRNENVSEDVEMEDVEPLRRETRPSVDSNSSRAETPLSGEENHLAQSNEPQQQKSALVAPTVPPMMRKKRPAPSPFMPPKRPRPPP